MSPVTWGQIALPVLLNGGKRTREDAPPSGPGLEYSCDPKHFLVGTILLPTLGSGVTTLAPPRGGAQNASTRDLANSPGFPPNLLPFFLDASAHRGEPSKPCRLHQAPTNRGAVRFWCSLPTADTSSFVPLELRVTGASGAPRYHRIIHINEVGKCAGKGGRGRGEEGPAPPT
jgi:hypothetical protein